MAVTKIDCRKMACPQPVINTKKALDQIGQGTVLVIVDNDTAKENVKLFAENSGYKVNVEAMEGEYHLTISKDFPGEITEKIWTSSIQTSISSLVYLITSNVLGEGSPDLGEVLMKSLMTTINEMEQAPEALLFLNTGVMLTSQGSPVINQLESLQSKGTQIISCGTCLEYYKLKDKLMVGRIGNMFEINDYLVQSNKVITIA